ncbi:MAG: hypothetical protein AAB403_13820 [Planctomycetota bacterium]
MRSGPTNNPTALRTTTYTHVLNRGGLAVHGPLERPGKPLSVERARITRTDRPA